MSASTNRATRWLSEAQLKVGDILVAALFIAPTDKPPGDGLNAGCAQLLQDEPKPNAPLSLEGHAVRGSDFSDGLLLPSFRTRAGSRLDQGSLTARTGRSWAKTLRTWSFHGRSACRFVVRSETDCGRCREQPDAPGRIARVLFCVRGGQMVLVHALVKRRSKLRKPTSRWASSG